jgi:hypothetical protein
MTTGTLIDVVFLVAVNAVLRDMQRFSRIRFGVKLAGGQTGHGFEKALNSAMRC